MLLCSADAYTVDNHKVNSHQCHASSFFSVPLIHMRQRSRHAEATKSWEVAKLLETDKVLIWICQECKLGEVERESMHSVLYRRWNWVDWVMSGRGNGGIYERERVDRPCTIWAKPTSILCWEEKHKWARLAGYCIWLAHVGRIKAAENRTLTKKGKLH